MTLAASDPPVIFIVDDEPVIRDSLALLLDVAGYATESYASAEDFLEGVAGRNPFGCVLADVCMPGISGLELMGEMSHRAIALPTVVITAHGDVPMTVKALKLGAVDFIEKPFDHAVLIGAIDEALHRAGSERKRRSEMESLEARVSLLTPREKEVLDLVVEGYSNKIIGRHLGISPRTVEIHRAHMMEKMGVTNVSSLLRIAIHLSMGRDS
jgi:two-component system response regulator FixJ